MNMMGHNGGPALTMNDAQALSFVQGQAYRINQQVYEARYPDYDFGRLIYVDSTGPEWSPGILTYTSDMSGRANWQSGYAKDIPLADVSQDMQQKTFHMAAIGYQWNIEEVNVAIQIGAPLPARRARAARLAYMQFMFNLTLFGDTEKGLGGLTNYGGVITTIAPSDGTGGVPYWVNSAGVGMKTPAQIVRDINIGIRGIRRGTFNTEMADTVLLPDEAYDYISSTPYSATTMETILSFIQRTNVYTRETGQQLTIRAFRELGAAGAGAAAGLGRMVVYKNDQDYVKLHLPMPHRFLPIYADGPLNSTVPGIFRTGGVELLTTVAMRYVDGISQPAADPS